MIMPPGLAHPFHRHPELEEIIYVVSGTAEQWVDREKQRLRAGEVARRHYEENGERKFLAYDSLS